MKSGSRQPSWQNALHRPLRFGRRWRGHELALRLIQVVLIAALGFTGAQLIAHGVSQGGRALAGLVSS